MENKKNTWIKSMSIRAKLKPILILHASVRAKINHTLILYTPIRAYINIMGRLLFGLGVAANRGRPCTGGSVAQRTRDRFAPP